MRVDNTGNDGLDFSGSKISVTDCLLTNVGDKCISGGENSEIDILNATISNSNIAVASKDKSTVKVGSCKINSCNFIYVAYQKKPEFGPAKIIASANKVENSVKLYEIEKGSSLIIDGKRQDGTDVISFNKFTVKK